MVKVRNVCFLILSIVVDVEFVLFLIFLALSEKYMVISLVLVFGYKCWLGRYFIYYIEKVDSVC